MSAIIEIREDDLRELIDAAEEVRDEACCVPQPPEFIRNFNALEPATEERFDRALEQIKFAMAL